MEPEVPTNSASTTDDHSPGPVPAEDLTVRRLEHDLELLEAEAKHVGIAASRRILPAVAAVLVLAFLAWFVGRRLRERAARRA